MEPQPEGHRQPPTDRIRTALGMGDGNERRVLVHLSDEKEEHAVVELFQRKGWSVLLCHEDVLFAVIEEEPNLCITDSGDDLAVLSILGGEMSVVAVITGGHEERTTAYADGADWVEIRPLDVNRRGGLGALAETG